MSSFDKLDLYLPLGLDDELLRVLGAAVWECDVLAILATANTGILGCWLLGSLHKVASISKILFRSIIVTKIVKTRFVAKITDIFIRTAKVYLGIFLVKCRAGFPKILIFSGSASRGM